MEETLVRLPRVSTFSSLANKDFRWLWLGTLLSHVSVQMQQLARGWLVFDMTKSPLALGVVIGSWGYPLRFFPCWAEP